MATRLAVIGWNGKALELDSDDASGLVAEKLIRVSCTKWGGEFADATVFHPHKDLLGIEMENATEGNYAEAWRIIKKLCPRAREFEYVTPVPIG